jgi:hypothetical protein
VNGRERIRRTLDRESVDRVPVDLGSTAVTGIQATTYARLRRALGLPDGPVRIEEPFQLLAEVEEPVRRALGVDTIGLWPRDTMFGFRNEGWKPWTLPDGTPALVSEHFRYTVDEKGDTLVYAKGDTTSAPAGRLPNGGYYFDATIRQQPIDEDRLDPADWAEQFSVFTDEDLRDLEARSRRLHEETEYSVVGCFAQAGVGDVAFVPGPMLTEPKGLRDPNLWYEYLAAHPDYIRGIFDIWIETAMKNLELYRQAVGDRIDVIFMGGTDFGGQQGPLVSPRMFRELWKPHFRRANDWVHENTRWKTFYHSCGSIVKLLDDFVEMGVDVLNPVQCSAAGMEAEGLKAAYGDRLVFWGGGVDTQATMPFGTPDEVRAQAEERRRGADGGDGFCSIHTIQARTPVENVLAFFEAAKGAPIVAARSAPPRLGSL